MTFCCTMAATQPLTALPAFVACLSSPFVIECDELRGGTLMCAADVALVHAEAAYGESRHLKQKIKTRVGTPKWLRP
jgi:hypothetical protein